MPNKTVYTYMYVKRHITNNHNSLSYNNPKLEATQLSINSRMGKLWDSHTMEYYREMRMNERKYTQRDESHK